MSKPENLTRREKSQLLSIVPQEMTRCYAYGLTDRMNKKEESSGKQGNGKAFPEDIFTKKDACTLDGKKQQIPLTQYFFGYYQADKLIAQIKQAKRSCEQATQADNKNHTGTTAFDKERACKEAKAAQTEFDTLLSTAKIKLESKADAVILIKK